MISRKTADKHERNNATAAAQILRNRASQPLVMILWAEIIQRRQTHAEKAEPATTAPPVQRPLSLVGESWA